MAVAHILILAFPLHGTIHPTLQLALRFLHAGARVTYVTTISAHRRMIRHPVPENLSLTFFSDGHDDGFDYQFSQDLIKVKDSNNLVHNHLVQFKEAATREVSALVRSEADGGHPVTCIVYPMLQYWVADLSRELNLPSFVLWLQPATVLAAYYHYLNGYEDQVKAIEKHATSAVELPGLPPLTANELPSFLLSSSTTLNMLPSFKDQLEAIEKQREEAHRRPRLLINTTDALERHAIASLDAFELITVGPLIPFEFFQEKYEAKSPGDYAKWLDAQAESSVVYISFGSIVVPSERQIEEILKGLLESRRPFFWVIREEEKWSDELRRAAESGEGLAVRWCSQVEVLSHPSTGCFLTHCGWNSTTESMALGVPMVCFPQWTDQGTNAKLVEDVWRTGVRVKVNEEGILESKELKRCLEQVMGSEQVEEIRENTKKVRDLVRETVVEGGSSYHKINAFVEEMATGTSH